MKSTQTSPQPTALLQTVHFQSENSIWTLTCTEEGCLMCFKNQNQTKRSWRAWTVKTLHWKLNFLKQEVNWRVSGELCLTSIECWRETNHVLLEQLDASKLKLQGLKKKLKQSDKIKEQNNELLENVRHVKALLTIRWKNWKKNLKMSRSNNSTTKKWTKNYSLNPKNSTVWKRRSLKLITVRNARRKNWRIERISNNICPIARTAKAKIASYGRAFHKQSTCKRGTALTIPAYEKLEQELTSVRQLLSEKSSRDDMVNALLIENERLARMLSSQPVLVTPQRTPTPMSPDNSVGCNVAFLTS